MITIRLSRTGKRHKPQYRIVVQEKHQDPWAPAKEVVGLYNPHTSPSTIEFKEESVKKWLANGAQPSETVHNMLINAGIIKGKKAKSVAISKKRATKLEGKKAEAEEAKNAAKEAAKAEAEVASEASNPEETPDESTKDLPVEEAVATETPTEEPKEEALADTASEADEQSVEAPTKEEAPAEEAKEESKEEEKATE